jgi:hypothetical protein
MKLDSAAYLRTAHRHSRRSRCEYRWITSFGLSRSDGKLMYQIVVEPDTRIGVARWSVDQCNDDPKRSDRYLISRSCRRAVGADNAEWRVPPDQRTITSSEFGSRVTDSCSLRWQGIISSA